MATHVLASFLTQANALFRKNLTYQGTTSEAGNTNHLDPGIYSDLPIYNIQPQCTPPNTTLSLSFG
ncbi:unnamed protein product [Arabis nemorensis]|uniref:Uncharacterized protein n=1 Tax=Arabis nemorensis TaxID=586526 RepID=A0A565BT06_9BRAS|nr:unnamed protein product [Arabis nemorensis]